jgi:hypothetical protein
LSFGIRRIRDYGTDMPLEGLAMTKLFSKPWRMPITIFGAVLLAACNDHSASSSSMAEPAAPAAANTLTLFWQAPTVNDNGSPLMNLAGYKIYYGTVPESLSKVIDVANPSLTSYVVENLATGTYYFAIASYNTLGVQSELTSPVEGTMD